MKRFDFVNDDGATVMIERPNNGNICIAIKESGDSFWSVALVPESQAETLLDVLRADAE